MVEPILPPLAADRRQLLISGALIAAFAAAPFWLHSRLRFSATGEATARELSVLTRVCDILIPATDTPGAADVETPDFVVLALNHGLDGTGEPAGSSTPSGSPAKGEASPQGLFVLDAFLDDLDRAARGDFLGVPAEQQVAALTAVDSAAFAPGGEMAAWHKIKDLILTGYYTSEAGASKELQYELVPGQWIADMATPPNARGFSSDWTALTFG
jgi:hypothetical protein